MKIWILKGPYGDYVWCRSQDRIRKFKAWAGRTLQERWVGPWGIDQEVT